MKAKDTIAEMEVSAALAPFKRYEEIEVVEIIPENITANWMEVALAARHSEQGKGEL